MNLFLDAVIHIFSSGVGQNDCPVIGFPGTQGAQPFDICLSVFEQCGGDFGSKNLPALLEKAVILPHDEGEDDACNGDDHHFREIADHVEDTAVPGGGRHADLPGDLAHLCVQGIKHPGQV